ncbi:MAG: TVP38/TMEM64 family protein [Clostridiales bacterium]|nr:TVP38/TMEM64 family protein [Clostridiales bacterium]
MNIKKIISLVFIIAIVLTIVSLRQDMVKVLQNPYKVRDYIQTYRNFAILIYLFLSTIRSIFLLPAGVFAIISGLTFGNILGTLLTCVGVTLSGVLSYLISKYLAREFILNILKKRFGKINNILKKQGLFYIVTLRLIPIFPFDAVSFTAGIVNISFFDFTLGTFIGSLPGAFIYTYLGNSLMDISSPNFKLAVLLVIITSTVPIIYKYVLKKG